MTNATTMGRDEAAQNKLLAKTPVELHHFDLEVSVDDVPGIARVTVEDAQYNTHQEYAVLARVAEITAEYRQVMWPKSRIPGILLDAYNAWKHIHLNAEIDALYSMLFGPHRARIEFVTVPQSDSRRAQAKLSFLMDVITITRHNEDRLQHCHC